MQVMDGIILIMDGVGASAGAGAGDILITDGVTTTLTATILITAIIMVTAVTTETTPTVQEADMPTTEDEAATLITTETEGVTLPNTILQAQEPTAEETIALEQAQETADNITIQAQLPQV